MRCCSSATVLSCCQKIIPICAYRQDRSFALASRFYKSNAVSSNFSRPENNTRSVSTSVPLAFKWVMANEKPATITGNYVILPDVPDETPENNAFLASVASNSNWPPLSSATPDEMYEGTLRVILDLGATVWEHLEMLEMDEEKGDVLRTFDNTVFPIITEEFDMHYAVNTLFLKMITDWPDCDPYHFKSDMAAISWASFREIFERLYEQPMVEALKKVLETEQDKLRPWERRYLEWSLLQAKLSGYVKCVKGDKTAFNQRYMNNEWQWVGQHYAARWNFNLWGDPGTTVQIGHRHMLKHASPKALRILARVHENPGIDPEKGPWIASCEPRSLFAALNYCSARDIRKDLWDTWVARASFASEITEYNNSRNIEEIRHAVEGLAKSLGFKTAAEHRIYAKMASSPETVRTFLDELVQRMRPVFLERLEGTWKSYAEEEEEREVSSLQAYDLFYICRREAEHHHDVDAKVLMQHFPFAPTFERILRISEQIFNIEFKEITGNTELERCHPTVRIFDVIDRTENAHLGKLYLDPYARKNKRIQNWLAILGRPANQIRGLEKLVYLVGDAEESGEQPCTGLLHHEELAQLLKAFGKVLHMLLARSPYHFFTLPLSPWNAFDFDAADFMPTFMKFLIYRPNLLMALSSPNVVSGELLSAEKAADYSNALGRSVFWDAYRTLFWSDFDLTLHNMLRWKDKFWLDLYKEMHREYFPNFTEIRNFQPCSFTPIFQTNLTASTYYRKLWCEMLALDVQEAFDVERNESATGERLKREWLNHGALEPQGELFKRFMGREPSMAGICYFYDPIPSESASNSNEEQLKIAPLIG